MHGPERSERCEKLCPLILKDNTDWLPLDEWHSVFESLVEVRMHLGVDLQLEVTPDIAIDGNVDVIAEANIHSVGEFDLVIPYRVTRLILIIIDTWEAIAARS